MADDPKPVGGAPKGPFAPRVWTPPKAEPEEKAREGPLVTEGMKARRREMDRRRREKALDSSSRKRTRWRAGRA